MQDDLGDGGEKASFMMIDHAGAQKIALETLDDAGHWPQMD